MPRPPAVLLALALAACARAPAPPPAAAPSFRDASAPIGSTTRGTASDLAGDWVVAAAYPGPLPVAPGTRVAVAPGAGGSVLWRLGGTELPTAATGPGRYRGAGADLWVLWVDDGFRTAVVGTPDGRFGWIMDRPGQAAPDRTLAAREMLDFNGYDLARLP
jgi:apolipoprotein D and lipocalin family protein